MSILRYFFASPLGQRMRRRISTQHIADDITKEYKYEITTRSTLP
jgi:hypothetical protein